MSYSEFTGWQKYYNKEPFLADRVEYQIATLSYLTSLNLGGKSDINDFLISQKEVKKIENKSKSLEASVLKVFG